MESLVFLEIHDILLSFHDIIQSRQVNQISGLITDLCFIPINEIKLDFLWQSPEILAFFKKFINFLVAEDESL